MICCHLESRQIELECTDSGLQSLIQAFSSAIHLGRGEVDLESPEPQTDQTPIIVRIVDTGEKARVLRKPDALLIEGAASYLTTFRANLEFLQNQGKEPHRHIHIEHYENHPYLSEDSVPLIVSIAE